MHINITNNEYTHMIWDHLAGTEQHAEVREGKASRMNSQSGLHCTGVQERYS